MKLIRNAFAASIAVAALAVAACSSHGSNSTGTAGNTNPGQGQIGSLNGTVGNTGTVGAHLTIGTGVNVTSLSWTISNGTNSYNGVVNIGDAQSVEWVAGGIAAGSGYVITVTGSDCSGDPCNGTSAAFPVVAGATVQAGLFVTCIVPPDASVAADVGTGSVEVDAGVTLVGTPPVQCPGITSLSINPAENVEGFASQLNLSTTGPTPLITWTVTPAGDGTFSNVNAANPTFTCTDTNGGAPLTITATVANPDSGLCAGQTFTTLSALFNCESGTLTCAQKNPALPNACGARPASTSSPTTTTAASCGPRLRRGHPGLPDAGTCVAPLPVPCTSASPVA